MRADARALDLRLQERRDGQAFGRGFDRSLLNAWAGAGYQSYFLRDRLGGHGVSPVGDSGPARLLDPRSEMQGRNMRRMHSPTPYTPRERTREGMQAKALHIHAPTSTPQTQKPSPHHAHAWPDRTRRPTPLRRRTCPAHIG